MTPKLVTEAEAAQRLQVKPKTLARWRWEGKGPAFRKIGRKVAYAESDLDEYLEGARRVSTTQRRESADGATHAA